MPVKYHQYKRVLLTTDFSELSARAIPHAISIVKKYRSNLYVLHVLEPILSPAEYSWAGIQIDDIESNREQYAEKKLMEWCETQLPEDINTRLLIRKGSAIFEILSTITEHEIDLVVAATHGHSGLSQVFFGSTTEKILKRSPVPVMAVR